MGLIPGSEDAPWRRNDNLPQFSCLENSTTQEPAGCDPWDYEESDRVDVRACLQTSRTTVPVVKESSYKRRSQFVCKVLFSINSTHS